MPSLLSMESPRWRPDPAAELVEQRGLRPDGVARRLLPFWYSRQVHGVPPTSNRHSLA